MQTIKTDPNITIFQIGNNHYTKEYKVYDSLEVVTLPDNTQIPVLIMFKGVKTALRIMYHISIN